MKKLEVLTEISDGLFWGRIESSKTEWLANGYGETIADMLNNVKDIIKDYVAHEGKNDKLYGKLDLDKVEFIVKHDLESFFEQHQELSVKGVAERAGIDEGLLRHYIKGRKNPSENQLFKIQNAIHDIGNSLSNIRII